MFTKKTFLSGLLLVSLVSNVIAASEEPWGYNDADSTHGAGPSSWGLYYPDCNGQRQSPVDITTTSKAALDDIRFKYKDAPLEIVNNGHTIQVNYGDGSKIHIGNNTYRLLQFHFHTPSEHTRFGQPYPMEVHFVHVDNNGLLGVIGVFIEEGEENAAFAQIMANAPVTEGTTVVEGALINAAKLLPVSVENYFHYSGSLTTPPCSEIVSWYVMKKPIQFSHEQITWFEELMHMNARPVQELNGREILENND